MALPGVAQAGYLADTLERLVREHAPRSVAIIGCAGGNGFERLFGFNLRRVVGVDINPSYLAEAERRYTGRFPNLELICSDITSQTCHFEPPDLIFAALVFEYIGVEAGLTSLRRLSRPGTLTATVLQRPHLDIGAVTPSPFSSLRKLDPVLRIVPPAQFHDSARQVGFTIRSSLPRTLPTGKAFEEVLLAVP